MVVRANKNDDELGGHIASFASVGTLFGTGQQHFWHAPHDDHGGDLVYSRGIPRPASMRAPSWKGDCPRSGCSTSAAK